MVVARGTRKIEISYLDPNDTKQQVIIEGDQGRYEVGEGVLRVYLGDRTLVVPLSRMIMIDDRLE